MFEIRILPKRSCAYLSHPVRIASGGKGPELPKHSSGDAPPHGRNHPSSNPVLRTSALNYEPTELRSPM